METAFPHGTIFPDALETLDVKKYTDYVPSFASATKFELLTKEEADSRVVGATAIRSLESVVEVLQYFMHDHYDSYVGVILRLL
jgi:hypothetical protein